MSSVKLSEQIYAGFTDDILKSITVGITTDKSDSSVSCVKTSDSVIIGASHTVKPSVSSPTSLSIATDSKTGVLIKSSHTIHSSSASSYASASASACASVGYNFGTKDSVGVVSSVDASNKYGDKFSVSSDLSSFVDISAKRDSIVGRYKNNGTSEIGLGYETSGKNIGVGFSRDRISFSFGFSM